MNSTIKNMLVVLLLALGSTHAVHAQYNPANPPEPEENIYYKLNVGASRDGVAYLYGAGRYLAGTAVTVRYSLRNSGYLFSHWTLNGEQYSTSSSFTYTMGAEDVNFVAHFSYNPGSPQEPSSSDAHKLFLETNNEAACSFNMASGTYVELDSYVTLTTYVNQGYVFLGWYEGDILVSNSTTFNYQMPGEDTVLTARFRYDPTNPSEPEGSDEQANVQVTARGDVNKDGVVDVTDVMIVVNSSLTGSLENALCDVNGDGVVDVTDAMIVVNISLNNK